MPVSQRVCRNVNRGGSFVAWIKQHKSTVREVEGQGEERRGAECLDGEGAGAATGATERERVEGCVAIQ